MENLFLAKFKTREEWLHAVLKNVRPIFKEAGFPLAETIRIGCGWPSARALSPRLRAVGECWHPDTAADKTANIVISLYLHENVEVAGTLIHELAHAATKNSGHQGEFVTCIRKVGLLGKPTEAATPDLKLAERLNALFKKIGDYPHAKVDGRKRKKQGTRLIKLECPECGYTIRTTMKWISIGTPTCCCGGDFE